MIAGRPRSLHGNDGGAQNTLSEDAPPLVRLRHVCKSYHSGTLALDGVDLAVGKGEFVSLLGPSGCGKSTLLRLIAGLGAVSGGSIDWPQSANETTGLSGRELGFVFQEPTLMPWATVFRNVYLPLKLAGLGRKDAAARVMEALAMVGLEAFADAYPRQLSGGMKMRVSIARALVTKPRLLLLDEPFAALDEITRFRLNNDLLLLWQRQQWTVIFVTSQRVRVGLSVAAYFGDERSPRPRHRRPADRGAIPAQRRFPDDACLYRVLPPDLGRARPRDRRRRGTMNPARPSSPADAPHRQVPRWISVAVPTVIGAIAIGLWEAIVRYLEIPKFILPTPSAIAIALVVNHATLGFALWNTLKITLAAFCAALVLGVSFAVLFAQSRLLEISLFPYAVILQVTPIVSIAPFILIWVGLDHIERALLILATVVAFFPILSNTILGLKSVDHNLHNLLDLYGASRWQRLTELQFPTALPYLLGGMKISGGLALIGAVVAEFVAGSGTGTGLAWRLIEAANRLDIPLMFAALILLSALGVTIFFSLSALERLLLHKWHESIVRREN